MTDIDTLLDDIVVDCTQTLFERARIDLVRVAAPEAPTESVGIIGFTGATVRGVLGLALNPELASRAARDAAEGRTTVDDWLGEMTNQLLGRIKNRLLAWSVEISVALPLVLRGLEVRLVRRVGEPMRTYAFVAGADAVIVWVDLQTTGEFVLVPAEDPKEMPIDEGGMILF